MVYFSCTGTTKTLAEYAADILGVKFPISTEIQRSPCDLSKRTKFNTFELS
ncbi:MAG: hypothetical protein NC548_64720, partial [Lachnospiraceae bacterium]|nr:hypothetical protein [Lachnospiraceae bacterium]